MTETPSQAGESTRDRRRVERESSRNRRATLIVVAAVLVLLSIVALLVLTSGALSTGKTVARSPLPGSNQPSGVTTAAPVVDITEPSSEMTKAPVGAETLAPIAPRLIIDVPGAGNRVSLTFDLCERDNDLAGYDEAIVNILLDKDVPATFFMGGKWAESHPDAAAFLGQQSLFEIGNHSWSHEDFTKIAEDEMVTEIVDAQDAIARLTGRTPLLWRFPFGPHSDRALEVVAEHGLVAIEWSLVTGDPDKNVDAADILRGVRSGAGPGSIIIMHANERGWHTAEALPAVVDYLRAEGYEIVTVGELIK